jgi:uncharacterized membrane-anchored protein YhcB (DUF1043 family)
MTRSSVANDSGSTEALKVKRCMWCLPAGLVVLLMGLMVQSALAAFVDVQVHQAERLERRWGADPERFEQVGYITVKQYMDRALLLDNGNADFLQMSGRLATWSLSSRVDVITDKKLTNQQVYRKAASNFESSLLERPYWPYVYSEYASLISLRLHQQDSEAQEQNELAQKLTRTWDNALKYGKNEPLIVRNLLTIGFANWHVSSWALKRKTIALFQKSVKSNSVIQREAIGIARLYQHTDVLCQFYQLEGEIPHVLLRECNKYN